MPAKEKINLTDKQLAFVHYRANGMGEVDAALKAGYGEHTAKRYKVGQLKNVKLAIKQINKDALLMAKIDKAWVLAEAKKQYERANSDGDVRNALGALDRIGKHVDISAFSEKIEITSDNELLERLQKGLARNGESK